MGCTHMYSTSIMHRNPQKIEACSKGGIVFKSHVSSFQRFYLFCACVLHESQCLVISHTPLRPHKLRCVPPVVSGQDKNLGRQSFLGRVPKWNMYRYGFTWICMFLIYIYICSIVCTGMQPQGYHQRILHIHRVGIGKIMEILSDPASCWATPGLALDPLNLQGQLARTAIRQAAVVFQQPWWWKSPRCPAPAYQEVLNHQTLLGDIWWYLGFTVSSIAPLD